MIVLYSVDIARGASRANNVSYYFTIIAWSSVTDNPLLLHFQLKTMSQVDARKTMSVFFFKYAKDIYDKFGFNKTTACPCLGNE